MDYIRLEIAIPAEYQEFFIAEFYDHDFSGFEQQNDRLIAYIPAIRFNDNARLAVVEWLRAQQERCYVISEVVEQEHDYNEEWEKTIQPFQIGEFFIRPGWSKSQPPEGTTLLEIDPKMAFGTGYHETTKLMLRNLTDYFSENASVLDVGTGTGILSIATLKKGASTALGIDIDEWSYENARENGIINEILDRFEVRLGSFEVVEDDVQYDLILANVNRNALLDMAGSLTKHLKKGGFLLLSGLFVGEKELIIQNEWFGSLTLDGEDSEGEWIMLAFRK